MSPRNDSTLDPAVLDEAAEWLMRLSESTVTDADLAAWECWRASSPECYRAWERAELVLSKLGGLPPSLAMAALDRPTHLGRRVAIGKLATLLALAPVAWGSWKLGEWQQWTADYRAAVGERRELTLADGSHITLNTDTAVDIRFDRHERLVMLRRGEILVQTAPDPSSSARPFLVHTDEGRMQALGTRFSVRERGGRTHLAVLEGAVRVRLADDNQAGQRVVDAGHRTDFSSRAFADLTPVATSVIAWTQGMLMADNMRLADFLAELTRYRRGFLRCDPSIANLRVSGAFPISDTQRTLNMLVQTYPVIATAHMNGFWVLLSPS